MYLYSKGANVPQTFLYLKGMKPKSIEPFYLAQEIRFWTKSRQSVLIREIWEQYQNILVSFQNDIGTFVLAFDITKCESKINYML
jgi:hypothetical protein